MLRAQPSPPRWVRSRRLGWADLGDVSLCPLGGGSLNSVRVNRQIVVAVGGDATVVLARCLYGVHVDHRPAQVRQAVQELMVDFSGYFVPFGHG
jgi:hypothetical protein